MVDVGGGIGSVSVQLSQAYPHLRFVVEDRESVVSVAPKVRPTMIQCSPMSSECLHGHLVRYATVVGLQAC